MWSRTFYAVIDNDITALMCHRILYICYYNNKTQQHDNMLPVQTISSYSWWLRTHFSFCSNRKKKLVISINWPLNFVDQMSEIFNSRNFFRGGAGVICGMHAVGTQAVNERTWIDPLLGSPWISYAIFYIIIKIVGHFEGAKVPKTIGDPDFFLSLRSRMEYLSMCEV